MIVGLNTVLMISEIATRNRLRFNSVTEFNLLLDLSAVRILCQVLTLLVKLSSSFTLAVLLISARPQIIVATPVVLCARQYIISAVQLFALVKRHLLVNIIFASLTLFPLHQQVVS